MTLDTLVADEAAAWLRLAFTPGLSARQQRELLRVHGSAPAVLHAAHEDPALSNTGAGIALRGPAATPAVEAALRWLEGPGRHLLVLGDPRYPRLLLEIEDPPLVLFARGNPALLHAPGVGIVGSRNASLQGCRDAESLAHALSDSGLCVVSGLARGIDASAHRGGLRAAGSTVAVMGTGPDRIYPAANIALARAIEEHGCLITEFALGAKEFHWNFPRRNRLISGLTRGVLVVEAARESGSLITAKCALEQGREVFAMPGSIHSPMSKGCHHLIRQGAKLVECAADVMEEIGWQPRGTPAQRNEEGESAPDPVLNAVPYAPTSMDQLADLTGLQIPALAACLSRFELSGNVQALPGGRFTRLK